MLNELRKCIVKEPDKIEEVRYTNGMKKERVVSEGRKIAAYFHRWHERFWTIAPSLMVGGHVGGQESEMTALVEYEDGSIHVVPAEWIVFCDR